MHVHIIIAEKLNPKILVNLANCEWFAEPSFACSKFYGYLLLCSSIDFSYVKSLNSPIFVPV